jgi:hypothetical protein
VTLDTILWLAGDTATAIVVVLLVGKRVFRALPVFCAYLTWGLFSDAVLYTGTHFRSDIYYNIYVAVLVVDSLFQFSVLVELSWSVLRPLRAVLPRWSLLVVAGVVALAGAVVWPLTTSPGAEAFSFGGQLIGHVQETFSILRILFFLLLAGCSQLLCIGWRDRELQIATGFGFYSLVSLAVWMQHRTGPQYHLLDQLVAFSYLCSLTYWAFCFMQKEAERRAFTPQMQGFLLAVAGNARSARIAMIDSSMDQPGRGRKR